MKKAYIAVALVVLVGVIAAVLLLTNKEDATTTNTQSVNTTNTTSGNNDTVYALADVKSHSTQNDCWSVIDGKVYNLTSYVPRHPGGIDEIVKACGNDGTSLFESQPKHGASAKNQLESLQIGILAN